MSTGEMANIYGAAISMSWAQASKNLTDLIFEGVTAALADANMSMSEVDSIVLAAHDLIDGRSLSSMVTAPAAGAYLRDEIRLSDDGLTALSLAAARVEAGESEVSVVAAWARASEADYMSTSRSSFDPFLHQTLGISEFDISAMRLSGWLSRHPNGTTQRARAAGLRADRAQATPWALKGPSDLQPLSYPIRPDEGPRWADVVVAMIIGKAPGAVRVAGVGHGTEPSDIGERSLVAMSAVRSATARALHASKRTVGDMAIIEVDGATLSDEAIALEAVGLCGEGQAFDCYVSSDRANQSGGAAAGWCFPAMGLVRAADCYFRLRSGVAGRAALAVGLGAAAQTSTAIVLEAA